MKTPAELIGDIKAALDPMEGDALAIHRLATLLGVLTAGPDAETAIDGINELAHVMRERSDNIRRHHDAASQAVQRLANP